MSEQRIAIDHAIERYVDACQTSTQSAQMQAKALIWERIDGLVVLSQPTEPTDAEIIAIPSEKAELLQWAIDLAKESYFNSPDEFDEGTYESLKEITALIAARQVTPTVLAVPRIPDRATVEAKVADLIEAESNYCYTLAVGEHEEQARQERDEAKAAHAGRAEVDDEQRAYAELEREMPG